jgi:hypothetical protein
MSVMSAAQASDTRRPSRHTRAWSFGPEGAGRGQQGGELQRCSTVRFCTSLATLGRVTATAGLAAITPPSTVYF